MHLLELVAHEYGVFAAVFGFDVAYFQVSGAAVAVNVDTVVIFEWQVVLEPEDFWLRRS